MPRIRTYFQSVWEKPRWRFLFSLAVVLFGVGLFFLAHRLGRYPAAADLNPIGSLQEISVGGRIRLRGVVTYADQDQIFIQDKTGSIRIGLGAHGEVYKTSELVTLSGITTARYSPSDGPSSV